MSAIAYEKIDRPMHGKLKRPLRQDTCTVLIRFSALLPISAPFRISAPHRICFWKISAHILISAPILTVFVIVKYRG